MKILSIDGVEIALIDANAAEMLKQLAKSEIGLGNLTVDLGSHEETSIIMENRTQYRTEHTKFNATLDISFVKRLTHEEFIVSPQVVFPLRTYG